MGQFRIRRQDHTSGPAGDHLVAVETQNRRVAQTADRTIAVEGAQGFGGIFNHGDVARRADR